jgi:hypothetical protein
VQIFLDESGYTGQDLLNPDQPVFTRAQEIEAGFLAGPRSDSVSYDRVRNAASADAGLARGAEIGADALRAAGRFGADRGYAVSWPSGGV